LITATAPEIVAGSGSGDLTFRDLKLLGRDRILTTNAFSSKLMTDPLWTRLLVRAAASSLWLWGVHLYYPVQSDGV
jgi:hypothetical protein